MPVERCTRMPCWLTLVGANGIMAKVTVPLSEDKSPAGNKKQDGASHSQRSAKPGESSTGDPTRRLFNLVDLEDVQPC